MLDDAVDAAIPGFPDGFAGILDAAAVPHADEELYDDALEEGRVLLENLVKDGCSESLVDASDHVLEALLGRSFFGLRVVGGCGFLWVAVGGLDELSKVGMLIEVLEVDGLSSAERILTVCGELYESATGRFDEFGFRQVGFCPPEPISVPALFAAGEEFRAVFRGEAEAFADGDLKVREAMFLLVGEHFEDGLEEGYEWRYRHPINLPYLGCGWCWWSRSEVVDGLFDIWCERSGFRSCLNAGHPFGDEGDFESATFPCGGP